MAVFKVGIIWNPSFTHNLLLTQKKPNKFIIGGITLILKLIISESEFSKRINIDKFYGPKQNKTKPTWPKKKKTGQYWFKLKNWSA